MSINPGYMGYGTIDGVGPFRFNSANITPKQSVEAPDLVGGDFNRNAWVYGKVEISGSISGPMTESFVAGANSVWAWATARTDCGLLSDRGLDLYYFCPPAGAGFNHQRIPSVLANTVSFSASAGEVCEFSLDIIGAQNTVFDNQATTRNTTAEKLITWDQVSLSIGDQGDWVQLGDECFESFNFEINNNVEAKYAICAGQAPGTQNLFPYALVPGLRNISGTLTGYNIPRSLGVSNWGDYQASDVSLITFNIGSLSVSANVAFHRVEPSLSVGPITSSIAFTGVTVQPF